MALRYPKDLQQLISYLKKLPGIGSKTAERFAFQLLNWDQAELESLGHLLHKIQKVLAKCEICGALIESRCSFCNAQDRNQELLCIVSSARDIFLIEDTRSFCGLYHVIGPLLSPIDGHMPEHLHLETLKKRIKKNQVKEIIIALDSTLEGDTTALFLKEKLAEWNLEISRLAFGIPVGSSLEYTDEGTLARALCGRQKF